MAALTSGVDAARLAEALETQKQVLREEQARTADIDRRAEEAAKIIAECARQRDESVRRQAALSETIVLYEDLVRLAGDPVPDVGATGPAPAAEAPDGDGQGEADAKPVARVGKLHYRLLHALRARGPLPLNELVAASGVSARRAKLQMAIDVQRRYVAFRRKEFELTHGGADLLRRFEEFRRSTGQELPPLDVPHSEADRDEADPETQTEGDEG